MGLDVEKYFERIGYRGSARVDFATLAELHRLHLLAIAYENLDVQLGRPVGLDVESIYRKVVEEHRGGWCYEMNGLFAWVLEELGFSLTRLAAAVRRAVVGDAAIGNHLALWVHLDEPHLADVGLGSGVFEPIPLVARAFQQRGFHYSLEALVGGWWRLHNHVTGDAPSFDFQLSPGDPAVFARQCQFLQTSPESRFTRVAVVQRHLDGAIAALRGRTLKRFHPCGVDERVIVDQDDYARTLLELFGLAPPALDVLWNKVVKQHAAFTAR